MAELNRNELEALRILWESGELKPAEIEERFGWPIDNGTLRSVLRVLTEKGHVRRRKSGKAFLYLAKKSRNSVLSDMAQTMARVFAGGSAAELVAQLIKTERLSTQEIEELRAIAGDIAAGKGPSNKRGK